MLHPSETMVHNPPVDHTESVGKENLAYDTASFEEMSTARASLYPR